MYYLTKEGHDLLNNLSDDPRAVALLMLLNSVKGFKDVNIVCYYYEFNFMYVFN